MVLALVFGVLALIAIFLEFYLPGGIFAVIGATLAFLGIFLTLGINAKWGVIFALTEVLLIACVIKLALYLLKKQNICLDDLEEEKEDRVKLQGKIGRVTKDLRPSGFVEIDGREIQAVSQGSYIKKGTKIEVVAQEGNRIIVK